MMNPPSDQNPIAMKNSFYLLIALLIPVAQAQQPAPDVLVKSITEEVVAILKKDKDIQAGDTKKVADLIEAKVVPHFNFIRMTRIAMARNWRLASPEQQKINSRRCWSGPIRRRSPITAISRSITSRCAPSPRIPRSR